MSGRELGGSSQQLFPQTGIFTCWVSPWRMWAILLNYCCLYCAPSSVFVFLYSILSTCLSVLVPLVLSVLVPLVLSSSVVNMYVVKADVWWRAQQAIPQLSEVHVEGVHGYGGAC